MDDWRLEHQRCEQGMWERKEQSRFATLWRQTNTSLTKTQRQTGTNGLLGSGNIRSRRKSELARKRQCPWQRRDKRSKATGSLFCRAKTQHSHVCHDNNIAQQQCMLGQKLAHDSQWRSSLISKLVTDVFQWTHYFTITNLSDWKGEVPVRTPGHPETNLDRALTPESPPTF